MSQCQIITECYDDATYFVLENEILRVRVLDYGATLMSIRYKPLHRETILGLRSFQDVQHQSFYLGAAIGRVANRIRNGTFTLHGQQIDLSKNGPHTLHGGKFGFDQRRFLGQISGEQLILSLVSDDGDQGFPGKVELQIIFELHQASLIMTTSVISDQDTLCDITQHTYFNLNPDQSEPISNHHLRLNSDTVYAIDPDGCTGPHTLKTKGTPFDFSTSKRIGEALDFTHEQIVRVKGLDHFYPRNDRSQDLFCELSGPDLTLTVKTSLPGAHVYSGNFLEPLKNGSDYPFLKPYGGICFETMHVPNNINFDVKEAPILPKNTKVTSITTYTYTLGGFHEPECC